MSLQGEMTIVVKFGGDPIAKSPFTVGVAAPLDLNNITVDNLDGSKTIYKRNHLHKECLVLTGTFYRI